MKWWLWIGILLSGILTSPSSGNMVALSKVEEYQLKAIFLLRFSNFVIWPKDIQLETHTKNFVICILGEDPFEEKLDVIIEREHYIIPSIEVSRLADYKQTRSCQILFIDKSEQACLKTILAFVKGYPILTVSEMEGFSKQGGMVEFFLLRNRVRFQISRSTLIAAGLKANANLFRVAKVID